MSPCVRSEIIIVLKQPKFLKMNKVIWETFKCIQILYEIEEKENSKSESKFFKPFHKVQVK